MDWKAIGTKLADVAPWLGAALGGPGGAAVGSLIATTLGTDNDPEKVAAILTKPGGGLDQEAVIELRKLEANMTIELQRLALQEKLAYIDDTKSARDLAAKGPHDKVRPSITFTLLFGVMFVVVAVFSPIAKEVLKDPTAASTIGIVVGFLFGELKQALTFYFGAPNPNTQKEINDLLQRKGNK